MIDSPKGIAVDHSIRRYRGCVKTILMMSLRVRSAVRVPTDLTFDKRPAGPKLQTNSGTEPVSGSDRVDSRKKLSDEKSGMPSRGNTWFASLNNAQLFSVRSTRSLPLTGSVPAEVYGFGPAGFLPEFEPSLPRPVLS